MKKKFLIATLSCIAMLSTFTACAETVTWYQGDKTLGENYKPDKKIFVPIDEEINFDGVLDEDVWQQSEAFRYVSTGEEIATKKGATHTGFTDATISIKTYFGKEGLYIGTEMEDSVIYKTEETGKRYMQTGFEIYLAIPSASTNVQAKQVFLMPNDTAAFGEWMVLPDDKGVGYYPTTANGLDIEVTIDGEGINSTNNISYTTEAILSWKDLGLTEKPEYIRMYPCAIRVREIPVEGATPTYVWHNVAEKLGSNYNEPRTWLKFTENGYVDRTKSVHEISASSTKLTEQGSIYANTIPERAVPVDVDEQRGFSYTATLKEDGLYVFAEGRHDYFNPVGTSFTKTSYFGFSINNKNNKNFYLHIFPNAYSGFDNAKCTVVEKDKATDGYNYQTYWEGFISWDSLEANEVVLADNPMDSTLLCGGEFYTNSQNGGDNAPSDKLQFKGKRGASEYWTIAPYGANLYQEQTTYLWNIATVKVPVTKAGLQGFNRFDDTRFNGYPTHTLQEYNGDRGVTFTPYYEQGVGLWVKGVANHNTIWTGNSSFWNLATHFELWISGKQAYITSINGLMCYVGFDAHRSVMWTQENESNVATTYTTTLLGLIPESWLIEKGVAVEKGYVIFEGVFSAGKGDGTKEAAGVYEELVSFSATSAKTWWWCADACLVDENGCSYLNGVTQGEGYEMSFVGDTEKAFTYKATLTKHGLILTATIKTDTALADAKLRLQYNLNAPYYCMSEQTHSSSQSSATWKKIKAVSAPEGSGYARTITFNLFFDWSKLSADFYNNNAGSNTNIQYCKLYGYNSEAPIDSQLYIAVGFIGTDEMTYNMQYVDGGSVLTKEQTSASWYEVGAWDPNRAMYNCVTKDGMTLQ